MRALLILAGSLFGGVCGGAISAKFGTWVQENMTEEELRDFQWACDRLELPIPQNPNDPSDEWKTRMDRRISELPDDEEREIRSEVAEILSNHDINVNAESAAV